MKAYILNKEEIGDFEYRFKSGDKWVIVHARDKETAKEIFEEFEDE